MNDYKQNNQAWMNIVLATHNVSFFYSFSHKLSYHTLCTYLSSYFLGAPREYVHLVLVLGLVWTSCQLSSTRILLVCLGPPSILLFVPTTHVSHVHPSLTTEQLNTSTQVNNMAMLYLIYNGHICICQSQNYYCVQLFFTLPLYSWAGQLAPTPNIENSNCR